MITRSDSRLSRRLTTIVSHHAQQSEQGASIVTVMAFMVVLLIATATMTTASLAAQRTSITGVAAAQARANANSGIEAARVFFATTSQESLPVSTGVDIATDQLTANGLTPDDVSVTVSRIAGTSSETTYSVVSSGKSQGGSSGDVTTAEATATFSLPGTKPREDPPEEAKTVPGLVFSATQLNLPQNMHMLGGATASSPETIECNTTVESTLVSRGQFKNSGTECRVTGNIWSGAGTTEDASSVETFVCTSNTEVQGSVYTTGKAVIADQCHITGEVYAQGDVTLSGNARIDGILHSAGNTTLNGMSRVGGDVFSTGSIVMNDTQSQSPRAVTGNLVTGESVTINGGTGLGAVSGNSDPQTITGGQIWATGDVTFTNAYNIVSGAIHSQGTVRTDKAIVLGDVYSRWDIDSKRRITGSATASDGNLYYNEINGNAWARWNVQQASGVEGNPMLKVGGSAYSAEGNVTVNTVGGVAWGFWSVAVNNSAGGRVVAYGHDANGDLTGNVYTGQGSSVAGNVTARWVQLGQGSRVSGAVASESLSWNASGWYGNAFVIGRATLKYPADSHITLSGGVTISASSPSVNWEQLRQQLGLPTAIASDSSTWPEESHAPITLDGISGNVVKNDTVQLPIVSEFPQVTSIESSYASWEGGWTRHIFSGANACSDAEAFIRSGDWSGKTRVEVYNCSDNGRTQMFNSAPGYLWSPVTLHGDLAIVSDSGFYFPSTNSSKSTFQSDDDGNTYNLYLIVPADAQVSRDVPVLSGAATMPSDKNNSASNSFVTFNDRGIPACTNSYGTISTNNQPLNIPAQVHTFFYTPCVISGPGFLATGELSDSRQPGAPFGQIVVGKASFSPWGNFRFTYSEMPYPWWPTSNDEIPDGETQLPDASQSNPRQVTVTSRTSAVSTAGVD